MSAARPTGERSTLLNPAPVRESGRYVLYWMTSARRPTWNHALDRAVQHARQLGRPLVVLEALGCRHRWANARSHRFLLQGMAANARAFAPTPVRHLACVERHPGEARGLLEALAARACVVVTDDWPCFGLPRLQAVAAASLDVSVEAVDANGVVPMRRAGRVFATAYAFRRWLHGQLREALAVTPTAEPLSGLGPDRAVLPAEVLRRWPSLSPEQLEDVALLDELDIDREVAPVQASGGATHAAAHLRAFVEDHLDRYAEDRGHPDLDGASGLSPWLHFGHLSSHQVVLAVLGREGCAPADLPSAGKGARAGWWGLSPGAEAFLDQLVTWRELGFNMAAGRPDHERFESLPDWARATLEAHSADPREQLYTLDQLEAADTHDELWNAAQRQLRVVGRIHNTLRMLWGKRILGWTREPREALAVMLELNNRWALDGRDPNSISGIFWTLGRYDRPWGPERPVFGKVRYMSSANQARKLRVREYLARWSAASAAT